jgi:hypothetical protein
MTYGSVAFAINLFRAILKAAIDAHGSYNMPNSAKRVSGE